MAFDKFLYALAKKYTDKVASTKLDVGANSDLIEQGEFNKYLTPAKEADIISNSNKLIYTTSRGYWTPRPLVTFIDDDGALDVLTKLKPTFTEKQVPCVLALYSLSPLINNQTYIDETLDLQNTHNWEIASHTYGHIRLSEKTEQEIRDDSVKSLSLLRGLGFNVESLVYPYGNINEDAKKVVREYYRSGITASSVNTNAWDGNIFNLYRKGFGTNNQTLDDYKAVVDNAVANNHWLIFISHCSDAAFDATQITILGQLIDYIKGLNVQIVNVRDGLNYYEPDVLAGAHPSDAGSSSPYFLLKKDGSLFSRNAISYDNLNSHPATDLASAYNNPLTIHSVNFTGKAGYPDAGTIVTVKGYGDGWHYQLWFDYHDNEMQIRRIDGTGSWTAWTTLVSTSLLATMQHYQIGAMNLYTAAQPITAYPSGRITHFPVNSLGSEGFPGSGTSIVIRSLDGWSRNLFYKYNTEEVYGRHTNPDTGEWTAWVKLGGGYGITSTRPTLVEIGYQFFDTTLGKPIWTKTAGVAEKDTLTLSAGATTSGNITITLDGIGVAVAVVAGDTIAQVDAKIRAATYTGWAIGGTAGSGVITFVKSVGGVCSAPAIVDTDNTGVAGTFAVTKAGVTPVWVDSAGTTVT